MKKIKKAKAARVRATRRAKAVKKIVEAQLAQVVGGITWKCYGSPCHNTSPCTGSP